MEKKILLLFVAFILPVGVWSNLGAQTPTMITLADTALINSAYYVPISTSDSVVHRTKPIHKSRRNTHIVDPVKEQLDYYLHGGKPADSLITPAETLFISLLKLPWVVPSLDRHIDPPKIKTEMTQQKSMGSLPSPTAFKLESLSSIQIQDRIWRSMFVDNMWDFSYTSPYLSQFRYKIDYVDPEKTKLYDESKEQDKSSPAEALSGLSTVLKDRKYWYTGYESTLQFSQNYVSSNWYKGGSSNLNLFSRNYFTFEYNKDKVKWFNELEYKLSVYNAQGDTIRKYRVADDLLRFHTNYGYKAYSNWYYSADAEVRTQLFNAYKENSKDLQAALFSPISLDFGLGMKYDLEKKSSKVYGRKFKLALNVAPVAYNMKWSADKNVDLARHGFKDNKNYLYQFISSFKAEMRWDINMNLSYISRLYYTTSYHDARVEWENTLNCALTKYLSTRFYVYLRYDDTTNPSTNWGRYLQINELVSIGLNYKIGK